MLFIMITASQDLALKPDTIDGMKPKKVSWHGLNLRRERKQLRLSQIDLAEDSGVGITTIRDLERLAKTNVNLTTMLALGKSLNIQWVCDFGVDIEKPLPNSNEPRGN